MDCSFGARGARVAVMGEVPDVLITLPCLQWREATRAHAFTGPAGLHLSRAYHPTILEAERYAEARRDGSRHVQQRQQLRLLKVYYEAATLSNIGDVAVTFRNRYDALEIDPSTAREVVKFSASCTVGRSY